MLERMILNSDINTLLTGSAGSGDADQNVLVAMPSVSDPR